MNGNKLLSKVDCSRGAPMGRRSIKDNLKAKVRLFRVILVDGDYDIGGAYWGGGTGTRSLYGAIGEGFETFLRANNRQEAKEKLLVDYPELKFYR